MEKFILIQGMDNYAVSNHGKVINVKTKRELAQSETNSGYLSVSLYQNYIKKSFRVHRLVAIAFIENKNNFPQVNHIDGDKKNNHVHNLEWVTAKQNDLHARQNGLKEQNKPIVSTELETGEQIVFHSIGEASSYLGINKGTIHKVLSGKRRKTKGYSFSYISK